ncbi:MAG: alpha/beta fold hydrolase [Planctomycetota bacterium]
MLANHAPVVVFSHCFTCNKDLKSTVRISRALAKLGVTVLRYDMRGLGGSSGRFDESNFSTNLADLAAATQFADRELGTVTGLVGHSFGGFASLVTAAGATQELRPKISALGFVATLAAPSETQHLADLLLRMNPAIERDGRGEVVIGGIRWSITLQMIEDFRRHHFSDQLNQIQCPALVLHSPVDATVGYDHALRLMTLIQSSRKEPTRINPVSLVSLPGSDHLLAGNPADVQFVSELLATWSHRYAGNNAEPKDGS